MSLVAIMVAAMLLVLAYRYFTLDGIVGQAGVATIQIADAAAATYHEQLAGFLTARRGDQTLEFPEEMRTSLIEIVLDSQIKRVRIIDDNSRIVFSTAKEDKIGSIVTDSTIVPALSGTPQSKALYRDVFNTFLGLRSEHPSDNHVITALPLQINHQGPVVGVFQIETEIHELVRQNERAQLLIAVTAAFLMAVLYFSLMASIRRIQRLVDVQHHALQERSDLLIALSAEMLNVEEAEKQRIAQSLHERIAQTLAAIKFGIERTSVNVRGSDERAAQMLQSLLDPMRSAIQEVRDTAADLHPSSLDDLGLLPTMRWLCNRFSETRPDVSVEQYFMISEQAIPRFLTPVVFRLAEDACNMLKGNEKVGKISLSLKMEHELIVMEIQDDATVYRGTETQSDHPYARVRDRALLSGATFSTRRNSWGSGLSVRIAWNTTTTE